MTLLQWDHAGQRITGAMKYALGVLAAAVALAACSGGSSGGSSPAPPQGSSSIVASPSSLALVQVGQKATLLLSETNGSSAISLDASGCNKVTNTSSSSAPQGVQLTVTAIAAGTCSLSASDASGRNLSIPVSVTVTSGTLQ